MKGHYFYNRFLGGFYFCSSSRIGCVKGFSFSSSHRARLGAHRSAVKGNPVGPSPARRLPASTFQFRCSLTRLVSWFRRSSWRGYSLGLHCRRKPSQPILESPKMQSVTRLCSLDRPLSFCPLLILGSGLYTSYVSCHSRTIAVPGPNFHQLLAQGHDPRSHHSHWRGWWRGCP